MTFLVDYSLNQAPNLTSKVAEITNNTVSCPAHAPKECYITIKKHDSDDTNLFLNLFSEGE